MAFIHPVTDKGVVDVYFVDRHPEQHGVTQQDDAVLDRFFFWIPVYSIVCHVCGIIVWSCQGRLPVPRPALARFTKLKGAPPCQLAVGSSAIMSIRITTAYLVDGKCISLTGYWG